MRVYRTQKIIDHGTFFTVYTKEYHMTKTKLWLIIAGTAAALAAGIISEGPKASALPSTEVTVDGVDFPVCHFEDCSDQPGSVGVWKDPSTGNQYLSLGEDLSIKIEE